VHRPHAVLFADQRHVLALAVDRQVAGHGQGVEERDAVFGDGELSGAGDLAQDGEFHVGELDDDDRVVHHPVFADRVFDLFGKLVARESVAIDLADDRQLDFALFVDGEDLQVSVRGTRIGGESVERVVGGCRVERGCQFGVLAVDGHREPVERFDADLVVLFDGGRNVGLYLLDVGRAFVGGARCQQQCAEYENPEMFHGFYVDLIFNVLNGCAKILLFFR
jgi:hypothetical protein